VLDDERVESEAKEKTPQGRGATGVVEAIVRVVESLGGTHDIDAIGIGAPGIVDHERGIVGHAPNLPDWDRVVPLAELVSDALGGTRVKLDNDVNVGTVAEHRLGAAKHADDVLGVFIGTGVGGGVILGGELRRGDSGLAGEIGHTVVHPGGRECSCSRRGHLEAYAGRAVMERVARHRAAYGETTMLVELAGDDRMTSSVFAKALEAGDAVAIELIDAAVDALGAAVTSAVTLLDIDVVVVGGGLGDRLGPSFVGRIEQAARTSLFSRTVPLRVVPASLGDRGGAMGAALMARS
jgi:glucokinase